TVKRSDVVRLLDKIKRDNGGRMADVVLMLLRRTFHWHERRTDDWRSPISRGLGADYYDPKANRGERVLSDDEIRRVWSATADGSTFSQIVRFLLLTGARRNEVAGMSWREIDGDLWTLPASRSKTKADVARPLSKAALAIIEAQPHVADCPWVFSTTF